MIAPVSTAAVPVAVYVLGGKQPVYRILEVGLGSAARLDQHDASGGVRNEDVAQAIAAASTELMKFVGDLGDEPGSGSHVHDVRMHKVIMAATLVTSVGRTCCDRVLALAECQISGCGAAWQRT